MKPILILICLAITLGSNAQLQSEGINVNSTYCLRRIANDTLRLDITIVIVNDSRSLYFYPKAFEQNIQGKQLQTSFKLLRHHTIQNLSFDVSTVGYNSYDSLVAIKPSDTLLIKYNDILLFPKSQKIIVNNYVFPDKGAIKSDAGKPKHLDKFTRGVKIIECNLIYEKGKIRDNLLIRNYISPPKS